MSVDALFVSKSIEILKRGKSHLRWRILLENKRSKPKMYVYMFSHFVETKSR